MENQEFTQLASPLAFSPIVNFDQIVTACMRALALSQLSAATVNPRLLARAAQRSSSATTSSFISSVHEHKRTRLLHQVLARLRLELDFLSVYQPLCAAYNR